jgi:putative transposase
VPAVRRLLLALPGGVGDLTAERWRRVYPLLPPPRPPPSRPHAAHRTVRAGLLWVMGTGAAWRDLPERFGPGPTVHRRYRRWRHAGLWPRLLAALWPRLLAALEPEDTPICA